MREIWGPVWLAAAICLMAMIGTTVRSFGAVAPVFFSFLPVVLVQMTRNQLALMDRVRDLEHVIQVERLRVEHQAGLAAEGSGTPSEE